MKHLRAAQIDSVCGGQGEEFRTIQIHEIPRFENPPIVLKHETYRFEEPSGYRPPRPIPMHWLPPRDPGLQEY